MPSAASAETISGLAPSSSKRVLEKKVELAAWPGRTTGISASLSSSCSCCLSSLAPRVARPSPPPLAPPLLLLRVALLPPPLLRLLRSLLVSLQINTLDQISGLCHGTYTAIHCKISKPGHGQKTFGWARTYCRRWCPAACWPSGVAKEVTQRRFDSAC
jgi:hypothetical protein